mgnify:CR=1 FL=1|tara:strand:- start:8533 stop:8874 length:342 start_codon:yes stop_codon:yes gene_type:complete
MKSEGTNEEHFSIDMGGKLPHRRSPDYASVFANGVILSFLPANEMYNITFYEDVLLVNSETLPVPDDKSSKTTFVDGDLLPTREDKVRISMREQDLRSLYDLLSKRFKDVNDV